MTIARVGIVVLTLAVAAVAARAQTTRPTLAALDAEIQQLYRETESRIVRVQVPVPVPVDDFLARFDPKVREQLKPNSPRLFVRSPATQPMQTAPDSGMMPLPSVSATLNVEFIGIILNRKGDVLLPLYVDPEFVTKPLIVAVDQEKATTARVVAADRLTALTIVRLAEPAGEVARFSKSRPADGAIVLMLPPARGQARLGLWTGVQDDNAILVNRDGQFAGIVRNGHALFPTTFAPVVEQLLHGGVVRRAQLGVQISVVRADDPQRVQLPALGARAAARVVDVLADSAAAQAGLQKGDLILSLGGEAVEDIATFAAAMVNKSGPIELVILRDGEQRKIVADLKVQ
ncbi:MAG: serine protease DegQ [Phycisphaerales bacterium]|jgi:hypothetical protein|nr:serine protease DegQ [Phycisphaerales bacterium]